jgi:hydrogenase expression/formation protein HypE
MHDPTEGGLLAGLSQLAGAAGVGIEVTRDAIPVRSETARICHEMGVDPLCIFGSGALIAAVPPGDVGAAMAGVDDRGLTVAEIGRVVEGHHGVSLDGEPLPDGVRDDLYDLWT